MASQPEQATEDTTPARPLHLCLYGGRKLRMEAFWVDSQGAKPALGTRPSQSTSIEREMLVRLTALSKAAGFQYRPTNTDFLMANFERISPFLRRTKAKWSQIFTDIKLDYGAQLMAEGAQS